MQTGKQFGLGGTLRLEWFQAHRTGGVGVLGAGRVRDEAGSFSSVGGVLTSSSHDLEEVSDLCE